MIRRAWLVGLVGMAVLAGGAGLPTRDGGASKSARPKAKAQTKAKAKMDDETKAAEEDQTLEYATFGGGCFWCIEAVFERIPGVKTAVSGYAGGTFPRPTYELVCTGETGHAEVVQVAYDPTMVTFEQLLEVFFASHDPTTLNRQGPDVGTQYRSIILAHDEGQAHAAMKFIQKLNNQNVFGFFLK